MISKSESTPALRKIPSTGEASALCTYSSTRINDMRLRACFTQKGPWRPHLAPGLRSLVHRSLYQFTSRCGVSGIRGSLTSIRRFTVLKLSSDRVSSLAAHAAGGSRGGILMAGLPSDAGRSMSARL